MDRPPEEWAKQVWKDMERKGMEEQGYTEGEAW